MQYNRIEIHFCYIKLLQFLYKIHNNIDVIFLTPKALCKKRGDLSLCNCIHYFPVIGLAIYKTNVFKKLCENSAGTKNNTLSKTGSFTIPKNNSIPEYIRLTKNLSFSSSSMPFILRFERIVSFATCRSSLPFRLMATPPNSLL